MALSTSHPIHVLLVEDSLPDRRLIEEYLRESSDLVFVVHHRETLRSSLTFLKEHKVDLVFLDLSLPDSFGEATIEGLYRAFPSIPIVVLTGRQAEEDGIGEGSIKIGAQDFLSKNELSTQILVRAVKYAMGRKEMMRNLEEAQVLAKMGSWELDIRSNAFRCSAPMYSIFERNNGHRLTNLADYLHATHPEDQAKVALALRESCENMGSLNIDHRILIPNGEVKYINLKGEVKQWHDDLKMVGTAQDITQRLEIERLTREKELATEAAKLRQDFLAKTSHEIRTPLNPILVLTDMLLRTKLSQEQREYLSIIRTAGDTLLALVNDVLDLSKIEAGKIEFNHQPFELVKVFDSIHEMMEVNAREKELDLFIELDPKLPEVVVGDRVRLAQVLLNLVGNAIKFTPNGYIAVSAEVVRQQAGSMSIRFAVRDTGIGIPQDKLKVIFESFQQLESNANRQYGGTGLGLTIVRQLVGLQNGRIDVESELGKGSTFRFELTFQLPEAGAPHAASSPSTTEIAGSKPPQVETGLDLSKVKGFRILLVEDNPLNQMVTKKLLEDWGIEADVANNGSEGIQMVERKAYDLILMDIQMPEMDGYEATEYIRQKMVAPNSQVPIIALTANAFTGSDDECLRVGMNDYISKPIAIQNLFDKIVRHARRPSASPQARAIAVPSVTVGYPPSNGSTHPKTNGHHVGKDSLSTEPMAQTYTDLSYLQEITGGEAGVIKATIQKFVDHTPEILGRLETTAQNGEYGDLAKAAHKLKSSVAFMGIDSIKDTIIRVETVAKSDEDKSVLPGLISEIRNVIQASFLELQQASSQL